MKGTVSRRESLVDFAMHATSVAAENPTAESTIGPSNVGTGEILQNALANGQLQDQNTNNDVNNLLSLIPSSFFMLNQVKFNLSPRVSLDNSPINVDNLEMQLLVHPDRLKVHYYTLTHT
jgi:hypothetical protein